MRTGLFFGSFDPIHIGHISIISSVLNGGYVDNVVVIPAWHNPFKEHNPASFMKRWEMCYQSTKDIPNVTCAQVEGILHDRLNLDKIPTHKVIDVYKNDSHFDNSEIYIITTSETFSEIPRWKKGEELINSNNFIVIKVDGYDMDWKLAGQVEASGHKCICDLNLKFISISSTEVRKMIKEDKITSPYIPSEAKLVIRKNNLYK